MTTLKKFHWFWAWDDEKEEVWLREMSNNGWHFVTVSFPSNYVFEQGEPIDYAYRLDYMINRKDKDNYLLLFEDAGWEYLGELGGWQYFRQQTSKGDVPEIYSDSRSKAKKYQRILLFLTIFLPIYLNTIFFVGAGTDSEFIRILTMLMAAIMVLYAYAMVRLLVRINQLRKSY